MPGSRYRPALVHGYNRDVKKLTLLMVAVALLAACSKNIQNSDAVRQSIVDYLKGRTGQTGLNMDLMQLDVTAVSYAKDEARATVYFRPKNSPDGGGMAMNYVLDRKGSKWVVRGRQENGANPHGGGAAEGGGAADGGTAMPPLPALPPGHGSTSTGAAPGGEMPAGHPAVGSKQ